MADPTPAPRKEIPRPVSKPKQALPAGAWDTHAHVFGPYDRYPLLPTPPYVPPLAPREDYLAMLDKAGFAHGVLVHPSANGFDNRTTADAVKSVWPRLRGIGVVPLDISDADLEKLDKAGLRGVRFVDHGRPPGAPGTLALKDVKTFAPRFRAIGWHAQIWASNAMIVAAGAELKSLGIPIIFDHMAFIDVAKGVKDPGFQAFLKLLADSDFHVKLTPGRVSTDYPNFTAVRPFHDAYLQTIPDRVVFGSDWPFIGNDDTLPDVGTMVDLFDAWTADKALRQKVFVTNPQKFYGKR